jgi:hypothetical protein
MGRNQPTSTRRVYQFERDWKKFARAPRKVDREAFAELIAFAHFHAAPIAHAASPYIFEMILLTMIVGLVQRAETLQSQDILQFYVPLTHNSVSIPLLQTTLRTIMMALRQRLAGQKHEVYTFARALRQEDQKALRVLLAVTHTHNTLVPQNTAEPSDEMLLASLVSIMRRIRQLEKEYVEGRPIVNLDEWNRICDG